MKELKTLRIEQDKTKLIINSSLIHGADTGRPSHRAPRSVAKPTSSQTVVPSKTVPVARQRRTARIFPLKIPSHRVIPQIVGIETAIGEAHPVIRIVFRSVIGVSGRGEVVENIVQPFSVPNVPRMRGVEVLHAGKHVVVWVGGLEAHQVFGLGEAQGLDVILLLHHVVDGLFGFRVDGFDGVLPATHGPVAAGLPGLSRGGVLVEALLEGHIEGADFLPAAALFFEMRNRFAKT